MTLSGHGIPFLPGNAVRQVTFDGNHKQHTLDYKNGYAVTRSANAHAPKEPQDPQAALQQLSEQLKADSTLAYGGKLSFLKDTTPRHIPAHVAFDKMTLTFDAYTRNAVHQGREEFHLRRVKIYYFVEDDTMSVVEPPVENSGLQQGVILKRQRIPKSATEYYQMRDLNVGIDVTFYGQTYRITRCDAFTVKMLREMAHVTVNAAEETPSDPFVEARRAQHMAGAPRAAKVDKLKQFLEHDREVLRFYAVWDDRATAGAGRPVRAFELHYYLVDDTVEIRELPNADREPKSMLLRRTRLPKSLEGLFDLSGAVLKTEYCHWTELAIGGTVNVFGRAFLLYDCDTYTRKYYQAHLDRPAQQLEPLQLELAPRYKAVEQVVPPYHGYGSVEDSLGSCKYLVLKPPRRDFQKLLENEHKTFRFVARLDTANKDDAGRRFVITFRLSDDMLSIYEPPARAGGTLAGKFLEPTRVLKPGSSLYDAEPRYYEANDLFVGASVLAYGRSFVLLDADEYVFNYMAQKPQQYPQNDLVKVVAKAKQLCIQTKETILAKAYQGGEMGRLEFAAFCAGADSTGSLTQHEWTVLIRASLDQSAVNNDKLAQLLN